MKIRRINLISLIFLISLTLRIFTPDSFSLSTQAIPQHKSIEQLFEAVGLSTAHWPKFSTKYMWDPVEVERELELFLSEQEEARPDELTSPPSASLDDPWVSAPDPFTWRDCFNFTNSAQYFGDVQMTEEEIEDNLRNYVFQLFYSDIQFACEVSIFDIALLLTLDSWILEMLELPFGGFCGGMSQAAREYYLDSDLIPLGRDYTWDLPPPNPDPDINRQTGGAVTESMIKMYMFWKGSAAFFNPAHLLNVMKIYFAYSPHSGGTNNQVEFQNLMDLMLQGTSWYEPVVLLLGFPYYIESNVGLMHFVLAYAHDQGLGQDPDLIYIYNNWNHYSSTNPLDYDDYVALAPGTGEFQGTHLDSNEPWTRICAYEPSPVYSSILTTFIYFLTEISGLIISSSVDVQVSDYEGRTIGPDSEGLLQLDFPAYYGTREETKKILWPSKANVPYEIVVTGTETSEYSLELTRLVDKQLLTQEIKRNINAGEQDIFTFNPGTDGFSLKRQGVRLHSPCQRTDCSLQLEWASYLKSDFARYEIYQSLTKGDLGTKIITLENKDATSYVITSLVPETTYYFTVRVIDTYGGFADSNQVTYTTPKYNFSIILQAAFIILTILVSTFFSIRWKKKKRDKAQ
jgi:hypothetical protein